MNVRCGGARATRFLGGALLALGAVGCAPRPTPYSGHGAIFYCDGAGGGSAVRNWGVDVRKGLTAAGFNGSFEEYDWETGLGMVADEDEAVRAKRAQAAHVARNISRYQARFPDAPVNVIGFSAGTAIAVYAVEALPADSQIDTLVMLSSSLSSAYDLSKALRHVRGDVYVTTSPKDEMLGELAPIFGTADRKFVGKNIGGIRGFYLPPDADAQTRRLYSKIVLLAWRPGWDKLGEEGQHAGTTAPAFIQHVIAPLLLREGPRYMSVYERGSGGTFEPPAR